MSRTILITGATGGVGRAVIHSLFELKTGFRVVAGVRSVERARQSFAGYPDLEFVEFDFENPQTHAGSLHVVDAVFLLRPPHLANVNAVFKPFIDTCQQLKIQQIMFLSVQGVEKSKVIPHNQIEKLIVDSGIPHIFVRPGYFMQNLITTLHADIANRRAVILPAGSAKFNWIDVDNIGEACAVLFMRFADYVNRALEITGSENENFGTVVNLINKVTGATIAYRNLNPFSFYRLKKSDGINPGMIIVMIMLHFLARFQKEPRISPVYEELTRKKPTTLEQFLGRERAAFQQK